MIPGAYRSFAMRPTWADTERSRLEQRLLWHYGRERAADILAGRDDKTNADLAAWGRILSADRHPPRTPDGP